MSKLLATPPAPPAIQAANVLRAWVARDEAAFHDEIAHICEYCSTGAAGLADENLELLGAVAGVLREKPLNSGSEPMARLCINLLMHLAGRSGADSVRASNTSLFG